MSYRFKGDLVIIEGTKNHIVPKPLPETPNIGYICLDSADNKLKYYDGESWVILHPEGFTKKRYLITLHANNNSNDTWLGFGHSARSNRSPWSPPKDVKVLKVSMTNRNGGNESNPLLSEVRAHIGDYGSGNINTSNDTGWYVTSDGENIEQNAEYGRQWTYDCSSEEDYMYANKQYAFRFRKLGGNGNPNDVVVTILLEES